ncbi:MAG: hypothetical protein V1732_00240 [Patescibacteria group bacterium]
MKTLAILAVILGILFVYFVVKAEKSFVIKGDEVVPSGIDIPKLILDKAKEIKSQVTDSGSGQGFINNITTDAKDLVSKTVDKISGLIKSPVENKINEILCPTK